MKIIFVYSGGRKQKLELVNSGVAPSDFFYGYWELAQTGADVDFVDMVEETQGSVPARLLNLLYYRWQILPCRTTGDLLTSLYRIRKQLNHYDAIVATTTGIGFALEILRRVGLLVPPILTIHCGVMNYTYNWLTNRLTKILLAGGMTQVFGFGECEAMRQRYQIESTRLELNEFGVDTDFWCPSVESVDSDYVLSVGNCGRRDYDLLMGVAKALECPVKVLTDDDSIRPPNNVEMIRGRIHTSYEVPDMQLRELYRSAAVVVVPLRESLQPSGQSVSLQAMACGKPVILTNTEGLWNRDLMCGGYNCLLVPVGDAQAMVEAIRFVMGKCRERENIGRNALETVRRHWTIKQFAERVEHTCRKIVYQQC